MKNLQNMTRFLLAGLLLVTISGMVSQAQASVGLGATRVIYPGGSKQVQLPVTNNDEKKTFLIQSWIENEEGKKVTSNKINPL